MIYSMHGESSPSAAKSVYGRSDELKTFPVFKRILNKMIEIHRSIYDKRVKAVIN